MFIRQRETFPKSQRDHSITSKTLCKKVNFISLPSNVASAPVSLTFRY